MNEIDSEIAKIEAELGLPSDSLLHSCRKMIGVNFKVLIDAIRKYKMTYGIFIVLGVLYRKGNGLAKDLVVREEKLKFIAEIIDPNSNTQGILSLL